MESKREGRAKKSKTESPVKERKSRKPAKERDKSRKNPLQEKIQSAKDTTDKRKSRRDFFTKDKKTDKQDEYRPKRRSYPRDNERDEQNSDGYKRKSYSRDNERDERSSDRNKRTSYPRDNERGERNSDGYKRRSYSRDNEREERSSDGYKRRSYSRDNERDERNSDGYKRRSYSRDNERDERNSDGYKRRSYPRDNERDERNSDGYKRRSYSRDNERDERNSDGYKRRSYSRDNERGEREERRPERYNRDNFARDNERNARPRKERRSKVLDSEIMREIVQRRRATGRSSNKPKVLSLKWGEERGAIRLNKYIANGGICSRREADDLIAAGAILVNGKVVTELGTKVMPTDEVRYEDKILQREKPVYILLNKPKDYITTTDDERSRDNVMMLIEGACPQRVYPVGRLDRNTTGLLLFTNDGELTKKLTHPRYGIKKIYQVELDRNMLLADFEALAEGIELEDGIMKPDELAFVDGKKNVLGITLHSGKNRIVRRLFDHLDYEVEKLDRVYYAGLTKKDLPRGEWRFLRQEEINILKMST